MKKKLFALYYTRKYTLRASKRRRVLSAVVWREPGVVCYHTPCAFCSGVAWAWRIYNIVKVKVTRWPVDPLTFSKKNPSRAIPRSTYIHPLSLPKIRQRTSEEIGNKHTNAARIIVWWSFINSELTIKMQQTEFSQAVVNIEKCILCWTVCLEVLHYSITYRCNSYKK